MKKIIGLAGTYCAGKNHLAAMLEKRGLPVLDLDILGHKALETEKIKAAARFGNEILNADGMINRRALGKKVFGDPEKLSALEAIVHPVVRCLTDQWISEQAGNCVVHGALLHKSNVFEQLDFIIIVNAPLITRIRRARLRDGLSWADLRVRFARQKGFYSQYFSGKADIYRVENPGFCNKPGVSSIKMRRLNAKLESKIDEILKKEGIL